MAVTHSQLLPLWIVMGIAGFVHAPLARADGTKLSTRTACNPRAFGAVGNGTTDDTAAIQGAIDSCAKHGGGTVELSALTAATTYLSGPITLKSHIQLQVDRDVTLQGTNDHSRYVAADINLPYRPNEALISAKGASDVSIAGAGVIDGAGYKAQPDGRQSWWDIARQQRDFRRPWLLEFYQCDHVRVSGVTLQNSPMWTQVFRFSRNIEASGMTIAVDKDRAESAPNTDGVDIVSSTNVTLSDLDIAVGDDNIAVKSGLAINDPRDPGEPGLPATASSHIHISNITAGRGHGISIGSELINGVNDVTIQGVRFTDTGNGLRIKSNRCRGNRIYGITASDLTMRGVSAPLVIDLYYMYGSCSWSSSGPDGDVARLPTTVTTPFVHDITIRNLVATDANGRSYVRGLPEACIRNLTLDNVSITTSGGGLDLRNVTGTFNNVTLTAGDSNSPFNVRENVNVTARGTTPSLPVTLPEKQNPCTSHSVP